MTNFTQVKGTRKQTWQILNTLLSRKSKEPTLIKNLKINPDNEINYLNEISNYINTYFANIGEELGKSTADTYII